MAFSYSSLLAIPSSYFTRSRIIIATATVSVCSIVYLTWFLPGFSVKTELARLLPTDSVDPEPQAQWSDNPRRLIVFGDSWSDNGQYPIDPPPKDQMPTREESQGRVWTEWLCSAIQCKHHDNFARSLPRSWNSGYSGAVVDSNHLNTTMFNTTAPNNISVAPFELGEPLADLRTQVQQWMTFEKKQYDTSRVTEVERNGTIFIVWLSLWDLWYYSEKEIVGAEHAVTIAMDTLFDQLDLVAENWPTEMKVILPEAIDATFLPGWRNVRTGPNGSDVQAENQRNAVVLVERWNRALDIRASRWQRGSMYIYNTNEWLLDQVRESQLTDSHLSDANGMGATQSPWTNVRSGCIGSTKASVDVGVTERCSDPNAYLFWDDMHLGPEAMKMIGEGVARDIAANGESSWFSHETDTAYRDKATSRPLKSPYGNSTLPANSDTRNTTASYTPSPTPKARLTQ